MSDEMVSSLLTAAAALAADLGDASDDEHALHTEERLLNCVVRPLRQAMGSGPGDSGRCGAGSGSVLTARAEPVTEDPSLSLAGELWQLARAATALRVRYPEMTELAEATATLQDLAVRLADEPEATGRLTELAELQAELSPGIQVMTDGPYLVTGARSLLDWLGRPLPVRPLLALCRCGASAIKPLCDGTHAATGFTGAKDPDRVPDRRDTYRGMQVTIFDNRGICQHSGLCTDRLTPVFHQGREPFIAPSGGRLDKIIGAVRDCPSGALGYGIDGVEAREEVAPEPGRPA